jgi:hypothetical protein
VREVEIFKWRKQWCEKWVTTKHKWTEADMRSRSPEAIKVEGTREVRLLPDTPEEHRAAQSNTSGPGGIRPASGEPQKMAWELAQEAQRLRK